MKITKITLVVCSLFISLIGCKEQNIPLYVGIFTDGDSEGIYKFQFNTQTGELSQMELAVATKNPSFLAYSPDKSHIYSVSNSDGGYAAAFKVKEEGTLEYINQVSSNGAGPCHISLNKAGSLAVVSNYGGGSASVYSITANGSLGPASQVFNYNTTAEKISRAHSAQFYKDELYVADLGTNAVYQYNLQGDNYKIGTPNIMETSENLGPRHFTISKNGQFIYIINEYGNSVISVERTSSGFKQIDFDTTLAEGFKGESYCADIHLSKDENFLYGSNRGENSIAVFKRNTTNGTLEKIQNIGVEGDWPRNFTLDPSGKFLLAANQRSNTITVFKIDGGTGKLSLISTVIAPTPVCLLF
ncbi:lactonase family protein [Cellulophaga sp. F20128]|uniref:lactonase family protein n=1 Tax=Cellulophaga sp. F20128 TaxID=2926413 RepID=UPI001FF5E585|nr:lactonase family protein [Cellulophaga sp. F20128]MCK0155689.1 lactonase family protein [Cellulophaga sp. F20128]